MNPGGQLARDGGTVAMSISARRLNRATLQRQMLLQRESLSIDEAMRRVVALQAQHPASPYLALFNRLSDFDPAALDAAYADYTVVRSTLLRITMHAVHADDYPAFREAMDPTLRGSRLRDDRFTVTGLTQEDVDVFIAELLDFATQPQTPEAFQAWLAERTQVEHKGIWWAMRQYAPMWHEPSGHPGSSRRHARTWPPHHGRRWPTRRSPTPRCRR